MAILSRFHSNELSCEADYPSTPELLSRIEVIIEGCYRSLVESKSSPSMILTRKTAQNTFLGAPEGCLTDSASLFLSHAKFERKLENGKSSIAFIRVWKVLVLCYQMLQLGKRATQREIFYRLLSDSPCHFQNQSQVNASIQGQTDTILETLPGSNHLADTVDLLQCGRHSLGILASSRGALVGRLLIEDPNGEIIDCTKLGSSGRVICGDVNFLQRLKYQSDARYVLVVEKDAIFQRLHEDRFFMTVPSIIITGKGFPDLATRIVLHQLHAVFPSLPIYALVDWNPSGLAIICTYKFGSMRMGLEAPTYVCDVKWIGLRFEDLREIPPESVLPLTNRDKTIANSLLASTMLQNYARHRNELMKMLESKKRVEIEALYAHGYGFLGKYVAQKIVRNDYI